ncbi:MAG: glycosyltransferase family 39 protein, partial [Anaerolineaceae bacterium]|nr:glycosyltransferase family 39 protein [Anaerolineaceae bacterium]
EYVWIARIYNAFFWLVGGLAVYAIGRRLAQASYAVLLGLAFYFFLPYSVIASRSFQPEPWMVMWIILTAYALVRWTELPGWKWALLAGLFGGAAILVKGVAGFFVAPMLAAALLSAITIPRLFRNPQVWLMAALTILPALAYYLFFHQERSAEFLSFWTGELLGMVLTTSFYARWLAMIKGLMSLSTFMAAILGVLIANRRVRPLLAGGWVGYGLYGLIFPYQYITHEYYHLPLVALVALGVIPVLEGLVQTLRLQAWGWRLLAIGVFLFASAYSLWVGRSILFAADYRNEPISWRRVGNDLPEGKRFIALTADYGTRLRYYGWRIPSAYWLSRSDLELFALAGREKIDFKFHFDEMTEGMDYFLVTALGEFESQTDLKSLLTKKYPVYLEGSGYLIYDLTHPISD